MVVEQQRNVASIVAAPRAQARGLVRADLLLQALFRKLSRVRS